MRLEFYKSAFCPCCAYPAQIRNKLQIGFDDIEVLTYDIATDLSVLKENNIRMTPAIVCAENKQSSLLPQEAQSRSFILDNR